MRVYDIIHKKREGYILSDQEIKFVIQGYTNGNIPDYQMSALAMAIFLKGMNGQETSSLTKAMAESGDMIDLSPFGSLSVDKHSTGGVGDKTTLIAAPLVACLGGKVAKMSGRGLGHTGGTIDKLESIKGFKTTLSPEDFMKQVEEIGISVIGQTGNMAPADKKLYALRDVTATVDSIPLIASSVMSKKIAAGAHSIVLDVKIGSGAFMKTYDEGEILAKEMVSIGNACGRNVAAVITNMDIPLGYAIGNSLEVIEAIEILSARGCPDLQKVCIALASNMLSLCHGWSIEESEAKAYDALVSGKALDKFSEWISAQGGEISWINDTNRFPRAPVIQEVLSPVSGYISHMDAESIGIMAAILGAGRERKEDSIDYSAGIQLKAKTEDFVKKGQPLAELHTSDISKARQVLDTFMSAIQMSNEEPEKLPLIYNVIMGQKQL